jgi:hypothetical protein
MSAPISFTPGEHDALSRVDKLSRAITGINQEIESTNRRILREKTKRDGLVARKRQISGRLRRILELIDTAKNRLEIP